MAFLSLALFFLIIVRKTRQTCLMEEVAAR